MSRQQQVNQLDTRKILVLKGQKKNKDVYYLPGYMRLKVKNFNQLQLQNLDAAFNATILLTIYYGSISKNLVKKLKNNIVLLFQRDDTIKLKNQEHLQLNVKQDDKKRQISFTLRKVFHAHIESQVFWSPFQLINLILTISVQPVVSRYGTIKVNLLDEQNQFIKTSYAAEGRFGNYDLAQKKLAVQYTNIRSSDVKRYGYSNDKKIKKYNQVLNKLEEQKQGKKGSKGINQLGQFQFAHFNVPLYKFPYVALGSIFFPLWLLALINLGIFFQDNNLADRIGSIATLMVAFVAMVPIIRHQIPPNPHLVFIEILVYIQTLTSLFVLIHSVDVRLTKGYAILWYQSGLFMLSFVITILQIVIIVVMMLIHRFIWQPSYNSDKETDDISKKVGFDRLRWKHQICDIFFNRLNQSIKDDKKKRFKQYPDQENVRQLREYDQKRRIQGNKIQ